MKQAPSSKKLHGNWSILENIALLRGFRLSPVLTKADISTIPQEAQGCGYVDITWKTVPAEEDRLHLSWKVNKTEKFSNEPLLEPF